MANKKTAAAAKHTRIRNWFQAAWFALTNGYVRGYTSGKIFTGNTKALCVPGLNCYSCPGALAACPIGSLQAVLNSSSYKISLYVFGWLTMFGVLFGRLVCGWMCPFGFVQDLLYKIKIGPKNKNLPGHKYLRYLRFVVLVVMVILLPALITNDGGSGQPWFCEWICPSGTLLGGIPLTLLNEEFRSVVGFRFFWKVSLLVVFCLGAIWWYRPFCKYLCPLGAIYGLFNPVSTYRLEIDPDKCIKCRACQRACGMDIATFETPNSMDCIRCGDCITACPKGAISSTWGKAQQQIKSRCFIDDEASSEAVASLPIPQKDVGIIRAMGIMMAVGGFAGLVQTVVLNLYLDFYYRLVLDSLENALPGSLVLCCAEFLACGLVFLTGLYVLRKNDVEKVKTADEKVLLALVLYVVGLVVYGVSCIFTPALLNFFMSFAMNCYCLLCLPLLKGLTYVVNKRLDGGTGKLAVSILLALVGIVTLATVGLTLYSLFGSMFTAEQAAEFMLFISC